MRLAVAEIHYKVVMWRTNHFTEGLPNHQGYPHFVDRGTVTEKISDFAKFAQSTDVIQIQTKYVSCQIITVF